MACAIADVAPKTRTLRAMADSGRDRAGSTTPEARREIRIDVAHEVAPGGVTRIEGRGGHARVLRRVDPPAVARHEVVAIAQQRAGARASIPKIQRDGDAGHRE